MANLNALDQLDRSLIALLRQDARQPVSSLAAQLSVSRATVTSRIARLVETGVIGRFTIEIARPPAAMVSAIMTIELQGRMSRGVIRALRGLPEVVELHSTNGAWDLVARIETEGLAQFDRVLRQVREIPGVLRSETSLLLDRAH